MPLQDIRGELCCLMNLDPHDRAVVDALFATDCFDVALTMIHQSFDHEDISASTKLVLHRACVTKSDRLSSDAKKQYNPQALLYHEPIHPWGWDMPEVALVFWPKRHRAWLVHGDNLVVTVVSKLTAPRSGKLPDDLRELCLASIFAFHDSKHDSSWALSDNGPLSPLQKLQLILYALGDVDLTVSTELRWI